MIELPLARSAHDRAAFRRTDGDWLAAAWPRSRVLLVDRRGRLAVDTVDTAGTVDTVNTVDNVAHGLALRYVEPASQVGSPANRAFLGEHEGTPYFAVLLPADADDADDADGWGSLRDVGAGLSALEVGLATSATALANWHATHPHCPRCGAPTEVVHAGWERRCPADGSSHFPRTDPAVIMLVHDGGDRCVLGRQPSWPDGRFSVLAGFVEPGEQAEAAVAREVDEEVGLAVTDVRFVASQPWPFPASLMLGFTARADPPGEIDRRDGELAEAAWFSREQIRNRADGMALLPSPVSIAYRLIMDWLGDNDGEADGER